MFLTQTNVIRGLSKSEYQQLAEMCRYSSNLYNVALYNIRQYFFSEKKFLTYENNYHVCKTNENYRLLQAGISQQILKAVDRNFKSFFNLLNKARRGDYRFHDVVLPKYRRRGDMFPLILSTNAIAIKDNYLQIPVSRTFKRLHPDCNIKIPFPKRLEDKVIKEVRILPMNRGKYFKIQYVYETDVEKADVDTSRVMAIDLGIDNLASCITTLGTSFILDGRRIKSINQGWNKKKARLQSIADKQGIKQTSRLFRITEKRNNKTKDVMRKAARYIVNYCIENKIGTLIVGYNADFKRYVNIGHVNNQSFTCIALGDLRQLLEGLCQRYGIVYIEQEESYTSKSSFLDDDALPVCGGEQTYHFSGRRICRGLYKSASGLLVNADVHAAANILRKSKQNFCKEELSRGLLASPVRIRLT